MKMREENHNFRSDITDILNFQQFRVKLKVQDFEITCKILMKINRFNL